MSRMNADYRDYKFIRMNDPRWEKDPPTYEVLSARIWFPDDPGRAAFYGTFQWTNRERYLQQAEAYYHYLQCELPELNDDVTFTVQNFVDQYPRTTFVM